jgi:hypothetical protein
MYNITFTASYNAYGYIKAGKKFKELNLFNDSKEKNSRQKIDPEKKKEELNYLLNVFENNKVGEINNV